MIRDVLTYIVIIFILYVYTLITPNARYKAMFKLTMKMNWGQLITAEFHTISQAIKYSKLFYCVTERKLSNGHGAVWIL